MHALLLVHTDFKILLVNAFLNLDYTFLFQHEIIYIETSFECQTYIEDHIFKCSVYKS